MSAPTPKWILGPASPAEDFVRFGGGKAKNLAVVSRAGVPVPEWFCLNAFAFDEFVRANAIEEALVPKESLAEFALRIERLFEELPLPPDVERELAAEIAARGWGEEHVAVRSSGLDEDSAAHSFAGLFTSYLDQRGMAAISRSVRRCWASAFSERGMRYRIERKIATGGLRVGVVIQRMLEPDAAGVLFTRDPIRPLERESMIVESVFGLGEGLVGGLLDADRFTVGRNDRKVESVAATKEFGIYRAAGGGVEKRPLPATKQSELSITDALALEIAALGARIEGLRGGAPQDVEWAVEKGRVYCLQTRPITSLPPEAYYSPEVNGREPNLWDNSNIVESFSGVTSPFTFSFASGVYQTVYRQFAEMMNAPESVVRENESAFRNMLGLIRGRIYYNLINWYRLLMILPGAANNAAFMETMLGVKKNLRAENQHVFDFLKRPPKYGIGLKLGLAARSIDRFLRRETIIREFKTVFNAAYDEARGKDFRRMSIPAQLAYFESLQDRILRRWQAPIVNDFLCMIFFGQLKKLTEKWVGGGDAGSSLQNDLLCGQGNLESTKPTKRLMEIARAIDEGDASFREWFVKSPAAEVWAALPAKSAAKHSLFLEFLSDYGFRCVNELKLEERDLHDDPTFVVNAVAGYVRMKTYSIEAMEERERKIKEAAEAAVDAKIGGLRRKLFYWVLRHARDAVRNREDLRFDRTKIYGIIRRLFRGVGANFVALGLLDSEHDVFYLTLEEIVAFGEGRHSTNELRGLAESRKAVFEEYRKTAEPPERFVTYGAVGTSLRYPSLLSAGDLLADFLPKSDDPNVLYGTPCCPGVVEGVVRVAHELKDTEGMAGEILVTARTDPGWVPLYPSSSGLLIERGSLLSHSAVVARELGLPTIVGISGGLMKKLKTGQRVRIDAAKGEVRIL